MSTVQSAFASVKGEFVSTPRKKILFAEPSSSGHRLSYVGLLARRALKKGHAVHVSLPEGSSGSPEFDTHLAGIADFIQLSSFEKFDLELLNRLSRDLGIDRTVVTDGDSLALPLARRGGWRGHGRLSLLIMRESVQSQKSWIHSIVKTVAKRIIVCGVSMMRNVDLAVLKSSTWTGRSTIRVALDPISLDCSKLDVDLLREGWNLDRDHFWFAVLGAITERKNVPLLALSLKELSHPSVGLLIAGKLHPTIEAEVLAATEQLRSVGIPVVVVNRMLADQELDAAVAGVDCVLLAHSNEGPSGLLGKAAAAATRVIASGAKSLRRDVQVLGNSAEWTRLDQPSVVEAMRRAVNAPSVTQASAVSVNSFVHTLLPED